jgi:hypothetical protein
VSVRVESEKMGVRGMACVFLHIPGSSCVRHARRHMSWVRPLSHCQAPRCVPNHRSNHDPALHAVEPAQSHRQPVHSRARARNTGEARGAQSRYLPESASGMCHASWMQSLML